MNITGIIAEFNPFHNGHMHLFNEARKRGADHLIVLMSGNFVQRGEPAVFDAHIRTEMALRCGADLVIELPVRYASASAEKFAFGGVSLLNSLGVVDHLIFGSENGHIDRLSKIAELLCSEPDDYRSSLKKALSEGLSFPAAREKAVLSCLDFSEKELSELLSGSNNILAIEYLKSLQALNSPIIPLTIPRLGEDYHGTKGPATDVSEDTPGDVSHFVSAESIRKKYFSKNDSAYSDNEIIKYTLESVPAEIHSFISDNDFIDHPVCADDYSLILRYLLLSAAQEEISSIDGITPDSADRIYKNKKDFVSFTEFAQNIATRSIPYSAVCRSLLHLILKLDKESSEGNGIKVSNSVYNEPEYARVLGFRRSAGRLLHEINKNSKIPIITKASDQRKLLTGRSADHFMEDIRSAEIYEGILAEKAHKAFRPELSRPLVII